MKSQAAHTPERSCRVCRTKAPKYELERWVISDGQLILDKHQVLPGRGAYTCRSQCSTQIDRFIRPRKRGRKAKN